MKIFSGSDERMVVWRSRQLITRFSYIFLLTFCKQKMWMQPNLNGTVLLQPFSFLGAWTLPLLLVYRYHNDSVPEIGNFIMCQKTCTHP
ncbi:hypothetical protein VNO77_10648 [Canavalia gladiata]|uniref:Uncharacterized protein n=1 Tax=Canavalia gladiata TaxID=3824 RepID=A0AAN9MH61_CANGL